MARQISIEKESDKCTYMCNNIHMCAHTHVYTCMVHTIYICIYRRVTCTHKQDYFPDG